MKAEDLRQISNDNIAEEKIQQCINVVEATMLKAAKAGERTCWVLIPMELSDKVYEHLERDGYGMVPVKYKGNIKLTIKW